MDRMLYSGMMLMIKRKGKCIIQLEFNKNELIRKKILHSYEYELIVVPGLVLNDSVIPIIKTYAKEPPILINPSDLGGINAAGKTFTMGIRLKSPKVS